MGIIEVPHSVARLVWAASKLVIVRSVGGLSRGLLWRRVQDPSQNPQMDCNQEPLAVCLTLSSLLLSTLSPRHAEFFKTWLRLGRKNKKGRQEEKSGFRQRLKRCTRELSPMTAGFVLFSWLFGKK